MSWGKRSMDPGERFLPLQSILILLTCTRLHTFWNQTGIPQIAGYMLLFSKISLKHTKRILSLKSEKPCAFSFFNFKSYILMTVMISSGIFVRKSGILSPDYLSLIYITMGIPLFLSAFRFYYNGIFYPRIIHKNEWNFL